MNTPLVFVLLVSVHVAYFKDVCKPHGVGSEMLVCVPILNCTNVLNKIREISSTIDRIQRLQSLTCGFEGREPKVCCPKVETTVTTNIMFKQGKLPSKNPLPTLNECGKSALDTTDYVLGGKAASPGAHPWVARIGYKTLDEPNFIHICGATLISRNFILLAAHCILALDPSRYIVTLDHSGKESTFEDNVRNNNYTVKALFTHDSYEKFTKYNDIALIQLSDVEYTKFVKPVCLPYAEMYHLKHIFGANGDPSAMTAEVTGFGRTSNAIGNSESPVLQVLDVPIVPNTVCQMIYEGRATISPKQMCAGGVDGQDSCDGDSGGGLFVKDQQKKRYFQIGIVSYGPSRCGSGGYPGVYTRISSYLDWIIETIKKNS